MKSDLRVGDKKVYKKVIAKNDLAGFSSGVVHPVYATFAIGRDIEWASRLLILDILADDEEGMGTYLQINHMAPALEDETVMITATVKSFAGRELWCDIEVRAGERIIATGATEQKIIKRTKIAALLKELEKNG